VPRKKQKQNICDEGGGGFDLLRRMGQRREK